MLYPQTNPFRQSVDLSGFWSFCFDPDGAGQANGWANGLSQKRPIAVPASWNDQFEDGRDYLADAWYETAFDLPWDWGSRRTYLHFGSVNYLAEVWLNGVRLGQHEGGHLPFEFDITPHVQAEANRLVLRVNGELAGTRVPPGNVPADPERGVPAVWERYPQAFFDFFPFCGIHRPVLLYAVAPEHITDITILTDIAGSEGRVQVRVDCSSIGKTTLRLKLSGHGVAISREAPVSQSTVIEFSVRDAALWAPASPNLYDLSVELVGNSGPIDRYTLPVGIRTIKIAGDQLLLNGRPVYLKGFNCHEDFPVTGRGLLPALIIKDHALMKWMGANSFRTSHYPYAEQVMQMADRLGFLVIDETPAVGLFFAQDGLEQRLELCRQQTRDLIARDKNHPSVILWSLANEPHSNHPAAKGFFRNLYDLAKSLDATRPVTLISSKGLLEEAFEFLDLLTLNRYYGWYDNAGQLDAACASLSQELDAMCRRFGKPLILAEFGVDTIPGCHAQPPEMFSEEYQADMLLKYIEVLRSKQYVVGELVWCMCDFKTGQDVRRPGGLNHKGIFTRDRRPKLAAHRLRELWR